MEKLFSAASPPSCMHSQFFAPPWTVLWWQQLAHSYVACLSACTGDGRPRAASGDDPGLPGYNGRAALCKPAGKYDGAIPASSRRCACGRDHRLLLGARVPLPAGADGQLPHATRVLREHDGLGALAAAARRGLCSSGVGA
eukprot:366131-Chlamydomonas_euryale.AAC.29